MLLKKSFAMKCADCGRNSTVPFKPAIGKPVYCRSCLSKRRSKRQESGDTHSIFDTKTVWAQRRNNWQGRKKKPADIFQKPW